MYPNQQYPPQGYGQPAYPPAQAPGVYPGAGAPALPGMTNGGVPQLPGMTDANVGGAGNTPTIAELAGRAIIAVPTRFDPNAKGIGDKKDVAVGAVTFDAYVLDGGPLSYGAAPKANPPRPAQFRVDTVPAKFTGIVSSNVNIMRVLSDKVGTGVVLGRVVQGIGTQGTPPWNLAPLDDSNPADAQARAVAQQVYAAVNAGQFVSPTPVPLVAQAPAQPAVPPVYGQYAGPPQGYPPLGAGAPAQQTPDVPPMGIPPALWATFSPDQKAQAHAAAAPPMPAGY